MNLPLVLQTTKVLIVGALIICGINKIRMMNKQEMGPRFLISRENGEGVNHRISVLLEELPKDQTR